MLQGSLEGNERGGVGTCITSHVVAGDNALGAGGLRGHESCRESGCCGKQKGWGHVVGKHEGDRTARE